MIDTTGSSLFKRGYRADKGGAPIKENMAAAILLLSNWYPDKPLIDPTCGSGTFCIEAAMIGMKMAPGLHRSFAFEDWNWVDKDLVAQARSTALSQIDQTIQLDISGSDIDGRMVETSSKKTLSKLRSCRSRFTSKADASLQDYITDQINGVIISNPP